MFNLEQAIADWRQQMLSAGVQAPVPLNELEAHLREDVEQQLRSGLGAQRAFQVSVARIGEPTQVRTEFEKTGTTGRMMLRTVVLILSLFGTVLGGSMVLPALGQWHNRGVLHPGPLLAGIALGIIALGLVIHGVRTHREASGRKLISIFMIAAGSFYTVPLIQAFFIPKIDLAGWIFCAALAAASLLFYGGCLYCLWHSPARSLGENRQEN